MAVSWFSWLVLCCCSRNECSTDGLGQTPLKACFPLQTRLVSIQVLVSLFPLCLFRGRQLPVSVQREKGGEYNAVVVVEKGCIVSYRIVRFYLTLSVTTHKPVFSRFFQQAREKDSCARATRLTPITRPCVWWPVACPGRVWYGTYVECHIHTPNNLLLF